MGWGITVTVRKRLEIYTVRAVVTTKPLIWGGITLTAIEIEIEAHTVTSILTIILT